MSKQQYAEMSDVRIYDINKKKLNKKFNFEDTSSQNQHQYMKVLNLNVTEEVTENVSQVSSKQSRLFPKTHQTFGWDKNTKGKVVVNWPNQSN